MDAEGYRTILTQLLPTGHAWPVSADSNLARLLVAPAAELARVDARAADLVREADPRTTLELLPDWERVAGLPDPCAGDVQTLAGRRGRLVQRLTGRGGQSARYFLDLVAAMGYPGAWVEEFAPAQCEGTCQQQLHSEADRFAWRLTIAAYTTTKVATCESACMEPLRDWRIAPIECAVRRRAPAHATTLIAYRDPILVTGGGEDLLGGEDLPFEAGIEGES